MLNIIKKVVPQEKWNIKCPYSMQPEFIVVHNTANDAPAENEIAYMTRNDKQLSFHYAVDDKCAIQGLELNRNGWHAGDGGNGAGNRKGIGIEICYSKCGGDKFINAEINGAKLVAYLLKQYGWGLDKVKKHQDFSKKYCPHRTLDMGWDRFLNMIQNELNCTEEKPSNDNPSLKPIDEIVNEIINGKWGNGEDRKNRLTEAGYDYSAVQTAVNAKLGTSTATPIPKKSIDEIANEVINGKWGNGEDRKNRLVGAGYNYSEVQNAVNAKLGTNTSAPAKKSVDEIAKEVINGKWGNGQDRKNRLTVAGYNYSAVQSKVNSLL